MQLLVIVLNKIKLLDILLEQFSKNKIYGATIFESTGMLRELTKNGEYLPIFGSLRYIIDINCKENKTIFMALEDEQITKAKEIIRSLVDIDKPDTAILFTLPISSAEGIRF